MQFPTAFYISILHLSFYIRSTGSLLRKFRSPGINIWWYNKIVNLSQNKRKQLSMEISVEIKLPKSMCILTMPLQRFDTCTSSFTSYGFIESWSFLPSSTVSVNIHGIISPTLNSSESACIPCRNESTFMSNSVTQTNNFYGSPGHFLTIWYNYACYL